MFKRAGQVMVTLLFAFSMALPMAPAQEKTQTKTRVTQVKTLEGDLVSLDAKKFSAVVKTDNGNQTVSLSRDIKVVGPRDGVRKDGLDDDDLDPGAKVHLTFAANNRTVTVLKIVAPAPAPKTATAPKTSSTKSATTTKTAGTKTTRTSTKTGADIKGPAGKIVAVDVPGMKFTIVDDTGRRNNFTFDSDTEFIGPRGGHGDKNGKDDRFVVGATVHLVLGVSNRAVKEVHLPFRNTIEK